MSPGLDLLVEQWRHERPDVDLTAFIITGTIKLIEAQSEGEFRRLAAKFGIAAGDLRVLLALRRSGIDNPRRPTDLFQSLLVTSGAMTKQVDRLVARNLVKRGADPSNQRGALIRLTARGAKVADTAIQAICTRETSIGAAVASLTDEEREFGKRFLQRLLAQFDESGSAAFEEPAADEAETADG